MRFSLHALPSLYPEVNQLDPGDSEAGAVKVIELLMGNSIEHWTNVKKPEHKHYAVPSVFRLSSFVLRLLTVQSLNQSSSSRSSASISASASAFDRPFAHSTSIAFARQKS